MQTNLNILAEYTRCINEVSLCTVESAEKAIEFCEKLGSEMILLHKDGKVIQYMKYNVNSNARAIQ